MVCRVVHGNNNRYFESQEGPVVVSLKKRTLPQFFLLGCRREVEMQCASTKGTGSSKEGNSRIGFQVLI